MGVPLALPPLLTFIPVNFLTDNWIKQIKNHDLDRNLKSLFILEGLLYYLPPESVDSIFRGVCDCASPGSLVCFDYLMERLQSGRAGEPILSWMERKKIHELLSTNGFEIVEEIDTKEMIRRYLTLQDRVPAEKPASKFNLVLADERIRGDASLLRDGQTATAKVDVGRVK